VYITLMGNDGGQAQGLRARIDEYFKTVSYPGQLPRNVRVSCRIWAGDGYHADATQDELLAPWGPGDAALEESYWGMSVRELLGK
jgi:hypothetical protein